MLLGCLDEVAQTVGRGFDAGSGQKQIDKLNTEVVLYLVTYSYDTLSYN